jgi:hypothetical protein
LLNHAIKAINSGKIGIDLVIIIAVKPYFLKKRLSSELISESNFTTPHLQIKYPIIFEQNKPKTEIDRDSTNPKAFAASVIIIVDGIGSTISESKNEKYNIAKYRFLCSLSS